MALSSRARRPSPERLQPQRQWGTASNLVQGLILCGQGYGSVGSHQNWSRDSLPLQDATNDFVGAISVTGGVLAATSNGALGDLANTITLNGTTATFRAADNITTSRTINFSNATATNNVFEVVGKGAP